jgi:hypothetical protein
MAAAASLPARLLVYLLFGPFCAAGPVMLLIAAGTGIERGLFIHSSAPTEGIVVAVRQVPGSTKKSTAPVFRFTTQSGMSVTANSNIYEEPSKWRVGAHVPVLYEEDHPENARIDSFWQLWMPQFVLGIVGGAFSIIPVFIYLRRAAPVGPGGRQQGETR